MVCETLTLCLFIATAEAQVTGVYDGDSIYVDGLNHRLETIDTPELGWRAECDAEKMLAQKAKERMAEIAPQATVEYTGRICGWNRPCIRLRLPSGRYAEEIMIEENLAVTWGGRRHDWCGPPS